MKIRQLIVVPQSGFLEVPGRKGNELETNAAARAGGLVRDLAGYLLTSSADARIIIREFQRDFNRPKLVLHLPRQRLGQGRIEKRGWHARRRTLRPAPRRIRAVKSAMKLGMA